MKISVIVPTYNEKDNLEALVREILALTANAAFQHTLQVVVVDDNSPDGTGALAEQLAAEHPGQVRVVHRSGKLGLGTAYIAGFRQGMADQSDVLISMDADFSHNPRHIPALVALIEAGYDLTIGSRYVKGGATVGCTLPRQVLSWGANMVARTLLGLRAHDATAGFRCYRRAVLESIALDEIFSSGYSFLVEMLYKVQRRGWKVGETPITFQNRQQGASKISRNEIRKAMYTVFRLAWERVRRKPDSSGATL